MPVTRTGRLGAVAVVAVALIGCDDRVTSMSNGSSSPRAQTMALYLEHVGESNKPIPPFVLCLDRPKEGWLRGRLGEPAWRYANIHPTTVPLLHAAEAIVIEQQPQVNDDGIGRHLSFQVTIVRGSPNETTTIRLDPQRSLAVFSALSELIPQAEVALQLDLRALIVRFGQPDHY